MKYVGNNLDLLMVSETKIDDTFPESIFNRGFSTPYRLHWAAKGGGILLYIRQDMPHKYMKKITVNKSFEEFFVELNLRSVNGFSDAHATPVKKKYFLFSPTPSEVFKVVMFLKRGSLILTNLQLQF